MKHKLKRIAINLALVGLLTLTFTAGVFTGQTGWLPKISPAWAAERPDELTVFWEAWNLIQANFVDRVALEDSDRLTYAALKALTNALGDTGHTRFLTPEEANRHNTAIEGRFFGIGAYLGLDEKDRPIIVSPFEGSPAQKAGLRAGDLILEVDGVDVTEETIDGIIQRIKGEQGMPVAITVLHRGAVEPEIVVVIRDEIIIPAISWTFIPNSKIALIRLGQFSASANDELIDALTRAREQGATGLILDVRNNAGGLLNQAIEVTSQFLESGTVLQEADAQGNHRPFPVSEGGLALDIPMVVLVNEITASSAEILAGAIQDHQRGLIIGEPTFGTGTVLTPYTLSDGSVLLLATAQWLTPNGRTIRRQGITPDIMVELSPEQPVLSPFGIDQLTEEELFHTGDAQLIEAIERLNNCWTKWGCEPFEE